MREENAIEVKNVSKNFLLPHEKHKSIKSLFTSLFQGKNGRKMEVQHALRDISFEVKKGEFFGIVGRNGSGKSTLLKMLAKIYQPTKGKINVDGKLVPFIELGVGFNPELTGRENVYLNGALLGFSKKEMEIQYDEIVKFAELDRFMDQKLKNYSSGMQVRLAFSVAIIADADILLVDEVLAVGDASFQRKCFEYFHLLKKNNKTVVFVTHDMNAVREYCDRALFIEKSQIVDIGKPDKIASQYTKLFNEASTTSNNEDPARWGDDKVNFSKPKLSNKLLIKNEEELVIETEAKVNQDLDDLVFGFSLKNRDGQMVLGTNSLIKKHRVGAVKKGESFKIVWKVPNVFPDGVFLVNLAAHSTDGVTVHDWWEGANRFEVINEERVHYPMNPPIELDLTRN